METKPGTKAMILAGFLFTLGNFIFAIYRYLMATIYVQQNVISSNPVYIGFSIFIPIIWWTVSTIDDNWNFYQRKNMTLNLVIINALMVIMMPLWTLVFNLVVTKICLIPVGRNLTEQMILNLCRIALIGICFGAGAGFYRLLGTVLSTEQTRRKIEGFRIQYVIDLRKNKEHLYDLNIAKNLVTGLAFLFKENDRFTHWFVDGATGGGKTSSTGGPAIVCDLNTKMKNALERQKALQDMIAKGHAKVNLPKEDENFFIDEARSEGGFSKDMEAEALVEPEKGYEKEFEKIKEKYPDAGITVMAPNNSLNKDVIRLCAARSMTVNVIDPAYQYDNENVHQVGINPFYIPLDISPDERTIDINSKAEAFSQVLMAVNELHGTGEQYFRDINTSVTTNIAVVCMLYANIHERQTNITEVQEAINEFHVLEPKVKAIEEHLHIKVEVHQVAKQSGKKGTVSRLDDEQAAIDENAKAMRQEMTEIESHSFSPLQSESEIPERYRLQGIGLDEYNDMLRDEANSYYETLHFIRQELVGDGEEKMFDQARGLRNLVNKLFRDPRIHRILLSKNFIDWDRALKNNEITVINTAMEFSQETSTALGLFIMLNMQTAVLRRPEKTRSNHFILIDEAAQYMHPMYDTMFSLYRQYRVAVTLMMQSIAQMDKNPNTAYLKGVVLQAGTHIVFGRAGSEEMKLYEQLSGVKYEEVVQTSRMSDSEFDENHKISHSERSQLQEKATVSGSDIRNRGFQEVTVFSTDQGRVVDAFLAKMSFTKKADYQNLHVSYVDWSEYFPKNWLERYNKKPITGGTKSERDSRGMINAGRTGIHTENVVSHPAKINTLPKEEKPASPVPRKVNAVTEEKAAQKRAVHRAEEAGDRIPKKEDVFNMSGSILDLLGNNELSQGDKTEKTKPKPVSQERKTIDGADEPAQPSKEEKPEETVPADVTEKASPGNKPSSENESADSDNTDEMPFGEAEQTVPEQQEPEDTAGSEDDDDEEERKKAELLAMLNRAKGINR